MTVRPRTAALLAVLAVTTVAALAAGGPAGSADQPKVQPVAEQNVDPSGAIRVHEQGVPIVKLDATGNTVRVPVSPGEPYRQCHTISLVDNAHFTVPVGKTLAMEHATAEITVTHGESAWIFGTFANSLVIPLETRLPSPSNPNDFDRLLTSLPMTDYLSEDFDLFLAHLADVAFGRVCIVGRLEPDA